MLSLVEIRTRIKKFKNEKLHSFTFALHKKGITANMLSAISLLFGIAAAFFVFNNSLHYALLIIPATILDILDGALSRHETNKKYGWLIDFLCDRTIMLCILIAACFYYSFNNIAPVIFLFLLVNALIFSFHIRKNRDPKSVIMFHFVEILLIFQLFELGLAFIAISSAINILAVGWQFKSKSSPAS